MTKYAGRHRPPTRAERRSAHGRNRSPRRRTRWALPTALTAVLALGAGLSFAPGDIVDRLGDVAAAGTGNDTSGDHGSQRTASDTDRSGQRQATGWVSPRERRAAENVVEAAEAARDEQATRRRAVATTPEWIMPVNDAPFTSGYGERWDRQHAGHDYAVDVGTPLRAMADGKVIAAGPMAGYGIRIDIRYSDGTVSRYGHLSETAAWVGQWVRKGDVVAKSGNTGRSTGPHLHLEIHPEGGEPVDPHPWLEKHGLDSGK